MTNNQFPEKICVCGNRDLQEYSPTYLRCAYCDTLIVSRPFDASITNVAEDDTGLYGREYWYSHQAEYGFPNIEIRARQDLADRCVYWLQKLLKYKRPPGKVLELGSSHGAFLALLNWAGWEATGIELSPSIVQFARDAFRVPVLLGTVETQHFAPESFDVIVLFDVLEHLPEPHTTISTCFRLLKPDGVLLIQTPQYPTGSYQHLVETGHSFLAMLKEQEHLYLFSAESLDRFLLAAGATGIIREQALYSHYDQFVIASKGEAHPLDPGDEFIPVEPSQRLVQALIDSGDRFHEIAREAEKREQGLHELTAIIAARDKRILDLNQTAAERLESLEQAATAYQTLAQEAEKREQGLHELTAIIAAREARIRDLEATAAERLESLERAATAYQILSEEAAKREAALHEAAAIIAERDARIAVLTQPSPKPADISTM